MALVNTTPNPIRFTDTVTNEDIILEPDSRFRLAGCPTSIESLTFEGQDTFALSVANVEKLTFDIYSTEELSEDESIIVAKVTAELLVKFNVQLPFRDVFYIDSTDCVMDELDGRVVMTCRRLRALR